MSAEPSAVQFVSRTTQKTARYALLGAPPGQARRVWFALHGYGQLIPRFARHFVDITPSDTCIVIPEALSRFYLAAPGRDGSHLQRVGATWMTREQRDDDIADNIRWLDAVYDDVVGHADTPVGILGFSQGVATATRWLSAGRPQARAFVAWAGSLAHDVSDAALARALGHAQVAVVRGANDELISEEGAHDALGTLRRISSTATLHTFDGGHHLEPTVLTLLLTRLSPALPLVP